MNLPSLQELLPPPAAASPSDDSLLIEQRPLDEPAARHWAGSGGTVPAEASSPGLPRTMIGAAAWALALLRLSGAERLRLAMSSAGTWRLFALDAPRGTVADWLEQVTQRSALAPIAAGCDTDTPCWLDAATPPPAVGLSARLGDTRGDPLGDRAEAPAGIPTLTIRAPAQGFSAQGLAILADAWMHAFGQLLAASGDTPIEALAPLPAPDQQRLASMLQHLDRPFPTAPTVPQRIEQQARTRPHATALRCEGRSLSYAELNARANRIARKLRGAGAGPGTRVAIAMARSADLVAALLAILKTGAAYLPLDASYPRERLEFKLADAEPAVLLADTASAASLPEHRPPTLRVDDPGLGLESEDDSDLGVSIAPESLAYVIYTSGSTGRPKGCRVSHANVMRLFTATEAWFRFGSDDRWAFFHSHAFDFSVWEIWGALVYGGTVVVVPASATRSPEAMHQLLVDEQVTVLNQTPSAFRLLIQADQAHADSPARLALRTIIFGGEALPLSMLAPWVEKHGDRRPELINMYGITETTVHVTYRRIRRDDIAAGRGSVIGEPIPDLAVFVLNAARQPVPTGVLGEIFVAGAGVSLGYLSRDDLNAERFIDWIVPGSGGRRLRLYKSGDIARWLPDGDLEYLGRSDHQVKIRGFRVELGEIEAALARHAGVRSCTVIARTDSATAEPRLVAYVVPRLPPGAAAAAGPGAAGGAAAWREHLAAWLAPHMVPSAFVTLASLPLTENGKLDRRALPAPARERPTGLQVPFVEPAAGAEMQIAEVWAQLLDLDRIGALDDFFELGGSSLQAVRAMWALRAAGLPALPVGTLYEARTARALAARMQQPLPAAVDDDATVADGPADDAATAVGADARRAPASFAQRSMWALAMRQPKARLNELFVPWLVSGPLQVDALQAALTDLVARHPTLRSLLKYERGKLDQITLPAQPMALDRREVPQPAPASGAAPEAEDQQAQKAREALRLQRGIAALNALVVEDATVDVIAGPPLLAHLLRLAPDQHILCLRVHHAMCDGWSTKVMLDDLAALYHARAAARLQGGSTGARHALPALVGQLSDLTRRELACAARGGFAAEVAWWRRELADLPPPVRLSMPELRKGRPDYRAEVRHAQRDAAFLDHVRDWARRHRVSPFAVFLAAMATLVQRRTGREDFLLGVPTLNRWTEPAMHWVGYATSLLPVRVRPRAALAFADLCAEVHSAISRVLTHGRVPLEVLLKETALSGFGQPIFAVWCQYLDEQAQPVEAAGLRFTPLPAPRRTMMAELDLDLYGSADGLRAEFGHRPSLVPGEAMSALVAEYFAILDAGLARG